MKITLGQLRENEFHKGHPIYREKIEQLKRSIRSTGFWDNIFVRTRDGNGLEIIYGRHRLMALNELVQELVIEKDFVLDVPVRIVDDATVLRIIAHEYGDTTTDRIDAIIKVALDFLEREAKVKRSDINFADIHQFLSAPWSERRIAASLKRINQK